MLRVRLILIILLSVAVLTAVLFAISTTILVRSYEVIEEEQIVRNIERVDFSIKDYSNTLNIKLRDWAQWDDTYEFIQGEREEYTDSNLADETLINLEINLMAFVNASGTIVFSKYIDPTTEIALPSEDITQKILGYEAYTGPDAMISGMIILPEGLLLIEALPIIRTDGSGPAVGTLFFGRILDAPFVDNIEELTRLSVDIFSQNTVPKDVYAVQRALDAKQGYVIRQLSDENSAGYFHIKDLNNKSVATVRIVTPRTVVQQGQSTITVYGLISTGAILLFGTIMFILFEFLLLRRLARISTEVDRISISNLTKARISDKKDDELGKLARTINHLLEGLSAARKKESEAINSEVTAHDKLKHSLKITEEMNKLMVGRELKMVELKEKVSQLESENHKLKDHTQ